MDEIRLVLGSFLLDLAEEFVELNRQIEKKRTTLRGRTQINLFFEASTRTQASFELAGKRLGADVMNMSVAHSSVKKGETPKAGEAIAGCHPGPALRGVAQTGIRNHRSLVFASGFDLLAQLIAARAGVFYLGQ